MVLKHGGRLDGVEAPVDALVHASSGEKTRGKSRLCGTFQAPEISPVIGDVSTEDHGTC